MLALALLLLATDPPVVTPEPADAHPGLKDADPLDGKYPLHRDPMRSKKLVAERRAWYAAQLDGELAKRPVDAKFTDPVRRATDAMIEILARPHGRTAELVDKRNAALDEAALAGCDDPAVLYYHRKFMPNKVKEFPARWVKKAADSFTADGRSAFRRLHANWNAAAETAEEAQRSLTDDDLKPFWATVAEVCKRPERAASEELLVVVDVALRGRLLAPDVNGRYKRLDGGLRAAGASEWTLLVVDGMNLIQWAWEARGTGFADTVSEDGWTFFRQRLEAAEDRFVRAHALDPGRPEAATGMITVCTGLSRERDEMEGWFIQALTADPDWWPAVAGKIGYLSPKWGGSLEGLLAFARQCHRAGTPDDQLGLALPLAYRQLRTKGVGDPLWGQPGVWADLRAGYEKHLAARPEDRQARTMFFKVCVLCGQWAAADAHRKRLEGKWWSSEFAGDDGSLGWWLAQLEAGLGKAKP